MLHGVRRRPDFSHTDCAAAITAVPWYDTVIDSSLTRNIYILREDFAGLVQVFIA